MADSTESLIYDEARRLIALQKDDRDALRQRAGTLLSAASLVTAFLGGLALAGFRETDPHAELTALAWSGLAAFIACVVLTVAILSPWPWTLALSPRILVEDHLKGGSKTDPDELRRFLAEKIEGHHKENAKVLNWLYAAFFAASLLLIYQAIAWLLVFGRG